MPRAAILLIVLAILLAIPVSATDLVITQPSPAEAHIAELRDFYVYGIFSGNVTNPGDIRIEVYKGDTPAGSPVRVIRSHVDPVSGITNASMINQSYCTLTGSCTRNNGAMVPDLVESPGGILDPSNKLVVTNRYYLGMIQGGATKGFETQYTGASGAPLADLTAGRYTIRVTGLSGNLAGQSVNETITLGLTRAALGRFSPASSKDAVTLYGKTHDRHVYFDWFAGYFNDPDNSTVSWQSPGRWTPNNAIEVVNDRPGTLIDTPAVADNAMFIYNINSQTATYGVELAAILRYGLEDNPNTTFLHYDTGEPVLQYRDALYGVRTLIGKPVPFPDGRRLVLERAEIMRPGAVSRENLYDPSDSITPRTLDLDPGNGITVPQGKEVILYGVTKPVASAVTPTATPYRFTIDNRIAAINCTITTDKGTLVSTGLHDVNLSRLLTPGSPKRSNSLWEFGIEVKGLRDPGTYTIRLAGIDTAGKPVDQTGTVVVATVVPRDFFSIWSDIGELLRERTLCRGEGGTNGRGITFFCPGKALQG
jgi:hypothetical protein